MGSIELLMAFFYESSQSFSGSNRRLLTLDSSSIYGISSTGLGAVRPVHGHVSLTRT